MYYVRAVLTVREITVRLARVYDSVRVGQRTATMIKIIIIIINRNATRVKELERAATCSIIIHDYTRGTYRRTFEIVRDLEPF